MSEKVDIMNISKKECVCYIDCRSDKRFSKDFFTLNMWGKPIYAYTIEAVRTAGIFKKIFMITDSKKIKEAMKKELDIEVKASFEKKEDLEFACIVSGKAPLITAETLKRACSEFVGGVLYTVKDSLGFDILNLHQKISFVEMDQKNIINAFIFYGPGEKQMPFKLDNSEAVVINSENDFELAIVLKKKQIQREVLKKNILSRIKEKTAVLQTALERPSICFVGHSQFDLWEIRELSGFAVRNCGISGISSFDYYNYILTTDLLNCSSDIFIVMHGTNDIVLDYEMKEIVDSIERTITYIRKRNSTAFIYFVACIHINGRLDRNNQIIDELNKALYLKMKEEVNWINTDLMNDEFGELKMAYTIDGLHLSTEGYQMLKTLIENAINS